MNYYEKLDYDFSVRVGNRTEFPAHYHEKAEILFVRGGVCDMLIGDTVYTLEQGDVAVAFPNVVHGYPYLDHGPPVLSPPRRNDSVMVIIDTEFAAAYQRVLLQSAPVCPVVRAKDAHPDLYYALERLTEVRREDGSVQGEEVEAYFQLFVMRLLRIVSLEANREPLHGDMIHRLIAYLSEHYLSPMDLDSIAAALHCDKYRISRLLSKELHTSFNDYVNGLRVNEAKKLIAQTDMPLSEVSAASGFLSVRSFNRQFSSRCGMTPSEYRCGLVRREAAE